MKRVLITGKGSYLGSFVKRELEKFPESYQVEELDMIDGSWKEHSFSGVDVVYHVAGLAHSTPKDSQKDLYYQVNTELAYQTALKAAEAGVKQFIFMSSVIVYGSGTIGEDRMIDADTPLDPDNFYGDSKKQAEIKLSSLKDQMKIVILRPPMIYGPGCKGNYPVLSSFAQKTPVFPDYDNQRSMLYVENLACFVRKAIDREAQGIFHPQNSAFVSTRRMIETVARVHGHKIHFISFLNPFLKLFQKNSAFNKVFGNLTIDPSLSALDWDYQAVDFETGIRKTEEAGMHA